MAYTRVNFQTKKALKEAVKGGEKVTVFNPNVELSPFFTDIDPNGKVYLEGPHYPQPHKWYAEAWLEGGAVVKVK